MARFEAISDEARLTDRNDQPFLNERRAHPVTDESEAMRSPLSARCQMTFPCQIVLTRPQCPCNVRLIANVGAAPRRCVSNSIRLTTKAGSR